MTAPPWFHDESLQVVNFEQWFRTRIREVSPSSKGHDGFPLWALHQVCDELWRQALDAGHDDVWAPIFGEDTLADDDTEAFITGS